MILCFPDPTRDQIYHGTEPISLQLKFDAISVVLTTKYISNIWKMYHRVLAISAFAHVKVSHWEGIWYLKWRRTSDADDNEWWFSIHSPVAAWQFRWMAILFPEQWTHIGIQLFGGTVLFTPMNFRKNMTMTLPWVPDDVNECSRPRGTQPSNSVYAKGYLSSW